MERSGGKQETTDYVIWATKKDSLAEPFFVLVKLWGHRLKRSNMRFCPYIAFGGRNRAKGDEIFNDTYFERMI